MKVKKGDTVLVIAGKDKGAKGKVIAAYPRQDKVLVEGVNRVKKHTRIRTTQRGAKTGGIVTQEAPIHVSNVHGRRLRRQADPRRLPHRRRTARRSAIAAYAPVRTCDDDGYRRQDACRGSRQRYRNEIVGAAAGAVQLRATPCRSPVW